jgi:tripartite-type tricarboxylate transporter receptor subunit TctC
MKPPWVMHSRHRAAASRIFTQVARLCHYRAHQHHVDARRILMPAMLTAAVASRRLALRYGCAATASLMGWAASRPVHAQPAIHPLRILCSGPAGSIPDIVARRVAEQLTVQHPQGAMVDNRPGAAGQIAVNALKASAPDGATVLLAQGAIATVYPYLYTKLAYDPVTDLQPVSMAGEMTLALAVGPAVPGSVGTIEELVDWMRGNPTQANVASPGTGTLPHLLEAMLFREANVPWQHVVYAGGPPAMVDLLGGQIAALVLPEGLFRQHKAAGKLRVLATSGTQRSRYFPDVATFVEQRYRSLVVREWFAFFMPAQVQPSTINAVSQRLQQAIARPELAAAFADSGMLAVSSTPAALASRIAQEQRYWQPIILAAGVKAE